MATRITDSTLVSKCAPVPRSVSGGEPGFISIHYRIFWLPKNIGGGVPLIRLSTFAEYETNLKMWDCVLFARWISAILFCFSITPQNHNDTLGKKIKFQKNIFCSIRNFAMGPFMTFNISVFVYQILFKYFSRDFQFKFYQNSWSSS